MNSGCYTAMVTPFDGAAVDETGLTRLADFQIQIGITGLLAVGPTGESPTLAWQEHHRVVQIISQHAKGKCLCIAGAGSNNTKEALSATRHAAEAGVDAVLLVDPYYNGPSSLEIRKEYLAPVAAAFPDLSIIPYIIPGRTGAQLLPDDLALLFREHPNVNTVKEATGDLDNMRRTRQCCGPEFTIFSGDDGLVYEMISDPEIAATGVISVVSNIVPKAMSDLVRLLVDKEIDQAKRLVDALRPLFGLVTVKTVEKSPYGDVVCRARNPLALKTLMQVLGVPSGPCRPPLGKMSRSGLDVVVNIAKTVQSKNPEIFAPLAEFFDVDIDGRLNDERLLEGLYYPTY
ncbi:4-hydroxy-tetrahydrodipicolinate synthase [Desulfosarcina sp.]|uniref:4-hydroxy-tetrahydrodipicolinate synthase n=1 Tax=Desulfosarcina sp. TaxID=2027861 RepID=UPI0029B7BF64|nr:4-hydroxy-tetrahydrodipicolinate synthase [Desulfosarcina sp.]MDX2454634.1 4-hydroxy-tetrahydrodipicolinate synthase [Desulfosarcina sp.]MDX2492258.1 4-hydroxy-tetrahydrodipicolinate synthase [Desulfosarcina sp.]